MRIKVPFLLLQFFIVPSEILDSKNLRIVQTEYGPAQGVQKQTVLGRDYFNLHEITAGETQIQITGTARTLV
jgi:hypothetical protein